MGSGMSAGAALFRTGFEATDDPVPLPGAIELDRSGHHRASGLDAPMATEVHPGPEYAPAARTGVGFSGLRALRYRVGHTATGRGYSYNVLFEVDLPVGPDTSLSYLIFPARTASGQLYAATYVAVDLAFDDGTYLSELGARDQHGATMNPQGQGGSATLYVDQWNRKLVRLGAVAPGKRIWRVLLAYDNPRGPAEVTGWLDDLEIGEVAEPGNDRRPIEYVDTRRGTHSSGEFSRGNTFPAVAVPHGFNFWSPMTDAGSLSWFYSYHQHNVVADGVPNLPAIRAFGLSHQPSPWMGDRQTFQVQPFTGSAGDGEPTADRERRALPFRHERETARPHYYRVECENGITVELSPTDHAAIFRFTFPTDSNRPGLLFDNVTGSGGLELDPAAGTVTGHTDVASRLSVGSRRMYVVARFDRPVVEHGLPADAGDRAPVTGYLRFDPGPDRTVTMRIATSLLSEEQAARTLDREIGAGRTLEDVRDAAEHAWHKRLGLIEVEGATTDQLVTLYSNLYRLFLYPNSGFETIQDGRDRYASPVSDAVGEGRMYVNNGFWDTYRTCWPAYALFTPRMAGEMIDGFLHQFSDGGWVSRWSSPGYADLMTGTSSDVAFADAYLKGVTGFDPLAAYRSALKNATVVPPDDSVGRKGVARSSFTGYVSTDTHEGLSWALEAYVNDAGIALHAERLAADASLPAADRRRYTEEARYFRARALGYVRHFDDRVGFFAGRGPDRSWRLSPEEFDPAVWGYDYTETNAWNMAFSVPHDGRGLAALYGGAKGLGEKLDEFFATAETGDVPGSYGRIIHEMTEARDVRMGQYGHSNQPSHHICYMYLFAGRPDRTQATVREVLTRLYTGSDIGQGYPGDEDNGEMSAWWLFSALGFYPLQVGRPMYAIGSPLFAKATVHLENGRDLVISAPANNRKNVYVQGVKVNGKRWRKAWLPHELLAEGGTVEFELGPERSGWGTGDEDAPPSLTANDRSPRPMRDATADLVHAVAGSTDHDAEPAGLFDDDATTEVELGGPSAWVELRLPEAVEVVMYTVTSSSVADGDPSAWRLQGSTDGTRWRTVDEREGETFEWRRQTRPFAVSSTGRYPQYRLVLVGGSSNAPIRLAELELLTW